MTQATILAFLASFVAGPALCALLLRLPAKVWMLALLAAGVGVAGLTALRLQAAGQAMPSLALLWFAWVLAVAMVAMALRGRMPTPRARRWLTIIALLATTLPWFGLSTAQWMS